MYANDGDDRGVRADPDALDPGTTSASASAAGDPALASAQSLADHYAFLLALDDALAGFADPKAVMTAACAALGVRLGVAHVYYCLVDERETHGTIGATYNDGRMRDLAHGMRFRIADHGADWREAMRAGRPVYAADLAADPRAISGPVSRTFGFAAETGLPLLRGGKLVAWLSAGHHEPREWSEADRRLQRDAAARTWPVVERVRAEAALRESEARYRLIVDRARDFAIVTTDDRRFITSWSPGARAVYKWTAEEIVGRPYALLLDGDDAAVDVPQRETDAASDVERHVTKDGCDVYVEGTMRALADEPGGGPGFVMIGRDVTERRAMAFALARSEARYRLLVENVRDHAIILLGADGVIAEWTAGAERIFGYRADEAVGRDVSLCDGEALHGAVQRDRAGPGCGRAESEGWRVRKNGERFWCNEIATAVHDDRGRLVGVTLIMRDLTERRLLAEASERRRAAADRNALHRRLWLAEEEERRRLSRELHDEAGQHLTALGLGLQSLSDVVVPGSEADRRTATLRRLTDALSRELHALALRLRPRALDDFGLEAALSAYAEEWSQHTGIAVEVRARFGAERLSPAFENAMYRIVQEALTNAARHGRARRAGIVVERDDRHVHLIVEDDGCGFDLAILDRGEADAPGLGLLGIRERTQLLGGALEIETSPGCGTTLFVRLPIDPGDGT